MRDAAPSEFDVPDGYRLAMADRSAHRRFPAPWGVIEVAEAFAVVDANGARLAFVYFDDVERGANSPRKLKPAALRMATEIASLPDLLRGEGTGETSYLPPGPWTARDRSSWFSVESAGGLLVAAVYVDEKGGRLTWDEARRIAANIVKLPDLGLVEANTSHPNHAPPLGFIPAIEIVLAQE